MFSIQCFFLFFQLSLEPATFYYIKNLRLISDFVVVLFFLGFIGSCSQLLHNWEGSLSLVFSVIRSSLILSLSYTPQVLFLFIVCYSTLSYSDIHYVYFLFYYHYFTNLNCFSSLSSLSSLEENFISFWTFNIFRPVTDIYFIVEFKSGWALERILVTNHAPVVLGAV